MTSIRVCIVLGLSLLGLLASHQPGTAPFKDAAWIAPSSAADPLTSLPLFRKNFTARARPARATLRIIGLGDYDARINGRRISETGINQAWSQYEKTLYYREFEVSSFIQPGANVLGVMLASSFWHNPNPPKDRYNKDGPQREAAEPLLLIAQLHLRYEDGSSVRIVTDESWRWTPGPIVFSHVFGGEDFDARKRLPGWDRPGFDANGWQPSRTVPAPAVELLRQDWPPFSAPQRFAPSRIDECAEGVFLYSFPQNCSAQLRVEMEGGHSGDRIAFRCGEHKNALGRLFGNYVVGCDLVTDGTRLVHQWLSFYLGMQFVEVKGAVPLGHPNPTGLPVIRSLHLVHVRTGLPEVGRFSSSNALFNDTHSLVDWAMKANMSHVLSDCPHREKLGWLECAYLLAPSFESAMSAGTGLKRSSGTCVTRRSPAAEFLPWHLLTPPADSRLPLAGLWNGERRRFCCPGSNTHGRTGDKGVLERNLEMMCRFTDCIEAEAKHGLAPGGLGDWYDYGPRSAARTVAVYTRAIVGDGHLGYVCSNGSKGCRGPGQNRPGPPLRRNA